MTQRRKVTPVGDHPLRHGYTPTDLHRLTKLACNTARGWLAMDYTDLMEAAWFGIVEHLYTAEHWPPAHDLVRAGQRAVNALVRDEMHHAGYYKAHTTTAHGPGSSPAFAKFWFNPHSGSPERGVVERAAMAQIMPRLTEAERAAVHALAVHDDYVLAAAALGLKQASFKSNIAKARKKFIALWHEHETPARVRHYYWRRLSPASGSGFQPGDAS